MSKRIEQVNQLIREEIARIIFKEIEFPSGVLVTVTRVDTSTNLNHSRVYISVLPENKTKEVLDTVKRNIYELQQKLNRRLIMRPIPRIEFFGEKETIKAGKVEILLEEIKKNW